MSASYIPAELRRLVRARAAGLCEYCLIHEDDTVFGCQVDHIVSEKHGGPTVEANLALACLFCNRNKGSDLGSLSSRTGALIRFFHPRLDLWAAHFRLGRDGISIVPLTEIGDVTLRILGINAAERLEERDELREAGRYPSEAALTRILDDPK